MTDSYDSGGGGFKYSAENLSFSQIVAIVNSDYDNRARATEVADGWRELAVFVEKIRSDLDTAQTTLAANFQTPNSDVFFGHVADVVASAESAVSPAEMNAESLDSAVAEVERLKPVIDDLVAEDNLYDDHRNEMASQASGGVTEYDSAKADVLAEARDQFHTSDQQFASQRFAMATPHEFEGPHWYGPDKMGEIGGYEHGYYPEGGGDHTGTTGGNSGSPAVTPGSSGPQLQGPATVGPAPAPPAGAPPVATPGGSPGGPPVGMLPGGAPPGAGGRPGVPPVRATGPLAGRPVTGPSAARPTPALPARPMGPTRTPGTHPMSPPNRTTSPRIPGGRPGGGPGMPAGRGGPGMPGAQPRSTAPGAGPGTGRPTGGHPAARATSAGPAGRTGHQAGRPSTGTPAGPRPGPRGVAKPNAGFEQSINRSLPKTTPGVVGGRDGGTSRPAQHGPTGSRITGARPKAGPRQPQHRPGSLTKNGVVTSGAKKTDPTWSRAKPAQRTSVPKGGVVGRREYFGAGQSSQQQEREARLQRREARMAKLTGKKSEEHELMRGINDHAVPGVIGNRATPSSGRQGPIFGPGGWTNG